MGSSTTTSTTSVASTTSITTTTTTAMECSGDDSRCAGKNEDQCRDLKKSGAHCRWEPVIAEVGECIGNDSRCRGAPRSRCERLSAWSDCVWKRKCKPWCATNSRAWSVKCGWEACQGCQQCNGRRLTEVEAQAAEDLPSKMVLV